MPHDRTGHRVAGEIHCAAKCCRVRACACQIIVWIQSYGARRAVVTHGGRDDHIVRIAQHERVRRGLHRFIEGGVHTYCVDTFAAPAAGDWLVTEGGWTSPCASATEPERPPCTNMTSASTGNHDLLSGPRALCHSTEPGVMAKRVFRVNASRAALIETQNVMIHLQRPSGPKHLTSCQPRVVCGVSALCFAGSGGKRAAVDRTRTTTAVAEHAPRAVVAAMASGCNGSKCWSAAKAPRTSDDQNRPLSIRAKMNRVDGHSQ